MKIHRIRINTFSCLILMVISLCFSFDNLRSCEESNSTDQVSGSTLVVLPPREGPNPFDTSNFLNDYVLPESDILYMSNCDSSLFAEYYVRYSIFDKFVKSYGSDISEYRLQALTHYYKKFESNIFNDSRFPHVDFVELFLVGDENPYCPDRHMYNYSRQLAYIVAIGPKRAYGFAGFDESEFNQFLLDQQYEIDSEEKAMDMARLYLHFHNRQALILDSNDVDSRRVYEKENIAEYLNKDISELNPTVTKDRNVYQVEMFILEEYGDNAYIFVRKIIFRCVSSDISYLKVHPDIFINKIKEKHKRKLKRDSTQTK